MTAHSLRRRLVLLAMVPAFCLLLVILATTTFARLDEQISQHEDGTRQMVRQFAASADYALMSNQPALLDSALRRLMSQPGVVAVRVDDQAGKPWRTVGDFAGALRRRDEVQRFSAVIERPRASADPNDWLSGSGGDAEGETGSEIIGQVEMLFDAGVLWRREVGLFFQLVLIGVSALLFIGIIAWLVATRLSSQMARVRADEERQRLLSRELLREREQRWQEEQARQQAWGKWSHDIRTPLHGVSGMLELLANTGLSEEQTVYLGQARDAARAMEDSLRLSPLPPAALNGMTDPDELAEAESVWLGRRVLLVEDDLISQHLLRGILEPWGVVLTCAGSGGEALARRDEPWDLVMIDGELPDMNAASLARAWGEGRPAGELPPLVAITAHSDPDRLRDYREAGLSPVLPKPLRRGHLLAVLTPLVAGNAGDPG